MSALGLLTTSFFLSLLWLWLFAIGLLIWASWKDKKAKKNNPLVQVAGAKERRDKERAQREKAIAAKMKDAGFMKVRANISGFSKPVEVTSNPDLFDAKEIGGSCVSSCSNWDLERLEEAFVTGTRTIHTLDVLEYVSVLEQLAAIDLEE